MSSIPERGWKEVEFDWVGDVEDLLEEERRNKILSRCIDPREEAKRKAERRLEQRKRKEEAEEDSDS